MLCCYLGNERNLVFLEAYNTDLDEIIIKFMEQNGRLLGIEEKVNLTLIVNKQKG